jgi:hypothetical protein
MYRLSLCSPYKVVCNLTHISLKHSYHTLDAFFQLSDMSVSPRSDSGPGIWPGAVTRVCVPRAA